MKVWAYLYLVPVQKFTIKNWGCPKVGKMPQSIYGHPDREIDDKSSDRLINHHKPLDLVVTCCNRCNLFWTNPEVEIGKCRCSVALRSPRDLGDEANQRDDSREHRKPLKHLILHSLAQLGTAWHSLAQH